MATILKFKQNRPEGQTCPRCEGSGIEATVFNQFVGETVAIPCGKCEATGWFTSLAHAEGEVR